MNIAIRYYTQTGNTKKLAEAIAAELGLEANPVSVPLEEKADLVFLCNSVYWAGIDKAVKQFIKDNADKIGAIVNVSTAALIESSCGQMQKLAAGAGVKLCEKEFHSHGGAEPCPFSPYSDINVRDTSLAEALNSSLFRALRENGHLLEDHAGGCVLYEKRDLVEALLAQSR